MSDILITLGVIALIVIGMVGAAVIRSWFDERRTKACRKSVEDLGLEFKAVDDEMMERETSGFRLMDQGHSPKVRNITSAVTDDVTIRLFDFEFTSGFGRHQSTYRQTVALIHSAALGLPTFKAKPETTVDKLTALVGIQDIDFDDHRAFSLAFALKSPMENETRKFFDPSLLDYFASKPTLSFEAAEGSSFIFFESKKSVKPKDLGGMLNEAYHVYALLRDRSTIVETPAIAKQPESEPALVGSS